MNAPGEVDAVGILTPMVMGLGFQPRSHVTQTVLVGPELDASSATQTIEPPHVLRRHGAAVGPHLLLTAVGKSRFTIELKVIETTPRHDARQEIKSGTRRHTITADIEHEATETVVVSCSIHRKPTSSRRHRRHADNLHVIVEKLIRQSCCTRS
ncbi:hypothetical protein PA07A_0066 [Cutibacterium acnes P07A]|nr:hypothetical protein [Cutibacterium acnes P07A]